MENIHAAAHLVLVKVQATGLPRGVLITKFGYLKVVAPIVS